MCILGAREMNEILDRFYLGTEHFIETRLITQHEPSYRASATIFAHHHRTKLESAALLHIIHVSKCIEDTPLRTFQTPTLSNFLNQRGADAVANPRKSERTLHLLLQIFKTISVTIIFTLGPQLLLNSFTASHGSYKITFQKEQRHHP